MGPNLRAISRSAIIAVGYVLVALTPDLLSLQDLRNSGPALREWRKGWKERPANNPEPSLELPASGAEPCGYIIQQHSIRMDRLVQTYDRWMARIPAVYRQSVLGRSASAESPRLGWDHYCLAPLKHYRSLMPMAMEARKPIFHLKSAE